MRTEITLLTMEAMVTQHTAPEHQLTNNCSSVLFAFDYRK